jgi:hypothetical protein
MEPLPISRAEVKEAFAALDAYGWPPVKETE